MTAAGVLVEGPHISLPPDKERTQLVPVRQLLLNLAVILNGRQKKMK